MIRKFHEADLDAVMALWLDANLQAHPFVPGDYWRDHFEEVRQALPEAEVYVSENGETAEIEGFIGLSGSYIAGIFVRSQSRSQGIGKQLLDQAKAVRASTGKTAAPSAFISGRAFRFFRRRRTAGPAKRSSSWRGAARRKDTDERACTQIANVGPRAGGF